MNSAPLCIIQPLYVRAVPRAASGAIFFGECFCTRYSLAIRLKSLPLYERAHLYESKCAHTATRVAATAVTSAVMPVVSRSERRSISMTRPWRAPPPVLFVPTDQFPSRYPCLSTKAAGRTIENLAGGSTRISRFTARRRQRTGDAAVFSVSPRTSARPFVHFGLQRPPRYPPIHPFPRAATRARLCVATCAHARATDMQYAYAVWCGMCVMCGVVCVCVSTYMYVCMCTYVRLYLYAM